MQTVEFTFIVEFQFNIMMACTINLIITVLRAPVGLGEQKMPALWNTIFTYREPLQLTVVNREPEKPLLTIRSILSCHSTFLII